MEIRLRLRHPIFIYLCIHICDCVRAYLCNTYRKWLSVPFQPGIFKCKMKSWLVILGTYRVLQKRKNAKRRHRWWVHEILTRMNEQGAYHNLVMELELDSEQFQQYFRLTREQFARVLQLVVEPLTIHSIFREVICPRQRLATCLR